MDPYTWDAPWFVIVGGLFVIVMLRANGTYWIGRLMEHGAHRTRLARLLDSPGYARALELVHRWGAPVVSASFLTIGVQTLVNLAAGATRMPLTRYLPAVALGGVAWALIYGTVGVAGFSALGLLWQRSPFLAGSLAVVLVVALAGFVSWRFREARSGRLDQSSSASGPAAQSEPAE